MPQFQHTPSTGTVLSSTVLDAAVTSGTQTTILLHSVALTVGPYTGPVAKNPQWALMIDNEIMIVTGLPGGNNVSVVRGAFGTPAQKHANGQTVWAAPMQWIPDVFATYSNVPPERFTVSTVPIGSVAYASFGNNTTVVAGTLYIADIYVPQGFLATGIATLIGLTGGTDKGISILYDQAGTIVANSAIAGATVGTASTIQKRAFSPGPVYVPASKYWLGYQQNGTTATLATVAASTFVDVLTASSTGTFATLPSPITVPTTFTANVGPIAYLY